MTIKEVESAIRQTILKDEHISVAGQCRDAAIRLSAVARQTDRNPPHVKTSYLVYPEAQLGEGVHYALRVSSLDGDITINPVRAPGFPRYLGPTEAAPGFLQAMLQTDDVV